MQFQGAFTALVTPFKDGQVDEEAYRRLVEWQIEQGISGLVPCGTTGESATLSHAEHKQVIKICVEQAQGRVPVLAGAGSNNTVEAVDLTRYAKEAGADGALLITPYYNKPTPNGLVAHFQTIAREVSMPFMVYNVPGRTGLNVQPSTMTRLYQEIPEIIGVKEASGNLRQVAEIVEACGPEFTVLSGEDFTVLPLLAVGGCGVISVVSNIAPGLMSGMCQAWLNNDPGKAQQLSLELLPLCRAMFLETNPIPAKTALWLMGRMDLELRLPLVHLTSDNQDRLQDTLQAKGLI
jgi:4-hydroxy-tetrahydrodipicolinate synthase